MTILIFISCNPNTDSIMKKAIETSELYIDLITNHKIDREWRKKYIKLIFHPDAFFLTGPINYPGISEEYHYKNGIYLFTTTKIDKKYIKKQHVDYNKIKDSIEDVVFIRIKYNVIAVNTLDTMTILDRQTTMYQYLILCNNEETNRFNIYDFYPYSHIEFINARYYLQNFEAYEINAHQKYDLERALSGQ